MKWLTRRFMKMCALPSSRTPRRSAGLRIESMESRDVPSATPDFYWKLDDIPTNGVVVDSAGVGAATSSNFTAGSGPSGEVPVLPYVDPRSRQFDGANDKVVTDAAINLNGVSLTIAAWVRVTAFSTAADHISSVAGIEEFNAGG